MPTSPERTALVRAATVHDLPTAAAVLARAFRDYPWTRWVVPADDHLARLEALQAVYLRIALDHGVVLLDDEVRAVAALLPPDVPEPPAEALREIARLHGDRMAVLHAHEAAEPPPGAWTLATLGVDPAHQGRGLGTLVAGAALTVVDDAGAPVVLETSDERNVALYRRLGFVLTASTRADDGPVVHAMTRAAR